MLGGNLVLGRAASAADVRDMLAGSKYDLFDLEKF
jgi:hypothetical protein